MPKERRRPSGHARGQASSRALLVSERLRADGLKHSSVRDAVLEAFFAAGKHVSIEELTRKTRDRVPQAAYSTVYRTLKLLVEKGYAAERDFGGTQTLYEPASGDHHDHLICTSCGSVTEFEDDAIERMQERVASRHGFEMRSHRLELYGHCARCSARRA
jgi:Fur family ferric uptake transcriptional regulator